MKRRHEAGFSTLEVVAAVAIIGIALIPMAVLQTQITRGQVNLEAAQADSTAAQNAMALLRDINPMLTPSGERRIDDRTTLTWSSAPSSRSREATNAPGFEVQLYRVTAAVSRSDAPVTTLQVDLIGWRPISEPVAE